jgi:5-methylcytosine-specific restriction protein A
MMDICEAQLLSLKPTRANKIMSLVAEAGIDVAPWATRLDGVAVKNASANPRYCYEWAFGGDGQPMAICVWHRELQADEGGIFYSESLREHALSLDRIAIEQGSPRDVKSRARDQARRARSFDQLLQQAYRNRLPVRVILLDGAKKDIKDLGWERSEVDVPELDAERWYMQSYSDETGKLRLVRGPKNTEVLPQAVAAPSQPEVPSGEEIGSNAEPKGEPAESAPEAMPEPTVEPVFVDQFSLPEPPERHSTTGAAFNRSAAIRKAVLQRAQGVCEHCGQPGFKTPSGAIFLETHHVISLCDAGPDEAWNVVGICPTDHRRAHFGDNGSDIQKQLLDLLVSIYPEARTALELLCSAERLSLASSR